MGLDMGLVNRPKFGEEVMYWRKANQIRAWFADNLENFHDNGETEVTKEKLEELLQLVKDTLANRDMASEWLPTSSGFFFGSTEYDEYYWEDLKHTEEALEEILQETDWENETITYWEWY